LRVKITVYWDVIAGKFLLDCVPSHLKRL